MMQLDNLDHQDPFLGMLVIKRLDDLIKTAIYLQFFVL
jgi:hypothetical protein